MYVRNHLLCVFNQIAGLDSLLCSHAVLLSLRGLSSIVKVTRRCCHDGVQLVVARLHVLEQVLVGAEEMRFLRSRARARMAPLNLKSANSVVSYGIFCVSS